MSMKSISWRPSDSWRNGLAASNQQSIAMHDAANAAFANAHANYFQGMASLAATAALKRVQHEASTKTAALQALTSAVGTTVNKTA